MVEVNLSVDAVILDLDGVLVDVSNSYRRAIRESIRQVYGFDITDQQIQALKDAGGFNNDWDVADALALHELLKQRSKFFDSSGWLETIQRGEGGLESAVEAGKELTSGSLFESVLEDWEPERLRDVFQQLYLGSDLYETLEGESSHLTTEGYIHHEPVIISDSVRDILLNNYAIGVLTGRPRAEAEIALNRVNLDLGPGCLIAMEDWGSSKPCPEGLERLAGELSAETVVFVGDTLDDIRTARRANNHDPKREYLGVGVLTGGLTGVRGEEKFKKEGAVKVLRTVNELVDWLD